jgi:4-amino-4-deoxy-L-arabinose transferase-like glycosyltransferase
MSAAAPRRDRRAALLLAAITLLAALLRLYRLGAVPDDAFYDAAVRSMSLSLHNFLYGAFDPGASASIDKPPLDLWLQVISVKLFGFGPVTLKLPEALGGTAAVPLLYGLVRPLSGRIAALAAAFVLAILPLSVVTSRSDTMDSVMMALAVATAWLLVVAARRRQLRWLVGAAVLLGLDFNVKLFEALVPLPAFAVFIWLAWRSLPMRTRLTRLAIATGVLAAVSCLWLAFVSLSPESDRPWPIGSTNGSVWNAVFVYNGLDRIGATIVAHGGALLSFAVLSPPGPLRLFVHNEIDYGGLIGTALFAAIVLALLAVGRDLLARRNPTIVWGIANEVDLAAFAGVAVWLVCGYLLFSFSSRSHPRYLEAFTPAVAIALGVSFVVVMWRALEDRRWALYLAAALLLCVLESAAGTGTFSRAGIYAVVLAAVAIAVVLAGLARRRGATPAWLTAPIAASILLAGVLALVMLDDDVRVIRDDSTVQASEVSVSPALTAALSRFLLAHQDGARYEAAFSAPTLAAPQIVKDGRPVLLLTSVKGRPLVTLPELEADARRGAVRYVFSEGICPGAIYTELPACSRADEWVRAHATDVTSKLGLAVKHGLLYRLPVAGS